MTVASSGTWGLWLLLAGAIAATYLWRGLGVLFASRIDPQGSLFQWVTCVSYAMLAGLVARMILVPAGPLVETPLLYRIAGIVIGLGLYFLFGRRLLIGVFAGLLTFIALAWVG